MANISRNTFDETKHYVSVIMQQGTPIVDSDLNAKEKIRKHLVESFIKSYIGDGVPAGNNGFRIYSPTLIFEQEEFGSGVEIEIDHRPQESGKTPHTAPITFDKEASPLVKGMDSSKKKTRKKSHTLKIEPGMQLVLKAEGLPMETIIFNEKDFEDSTKVTTEEIVAAINKKSKQFKAAIPKENDFIIKAGTCLVDGQQAFNEENIRYTQQPLFNNPNLAKAWGVPPLSPLSPPASGERTDLVYLDTWEREVNSQEDPDLVNPAIGIETCVPIKREWGVRVAAGTTNLPKPTEGHFYYPLASIKRTANENNIYPDNITDLRNTGLTMTTLQDDIANHDHSQLVTPGASPEPELSVDNEGNIGIGTTNPQAKLHIKSNLDASLTGGGVLVIGDIASQNIVLDNNEIMARNNGQKSTLQLQVEGGDLIVNNNKPFIIKDNGNVGIGTPHPQAKLQIISNSDAALGGGGALVIGNTSNKNIVLDTNEIMARSAGEISTLHLQAEGGTLKVHNSFIIEDSGNVGIGTNSPKRKLHVKGNAGAFELEGNNHVYIEFYPDGHSAGRKAWTGFGSTGDNNFSITNQVNNADIVIKTTGSGRTKVYRLTPMGEDYAEYFESKNGKEIKPGISVVLDGEKIRAAKKGETPIGIISANPGIAGGLPIEWPKKYLRDDFGRVLEEEYKVEIEALDEKGNPMMTGSGKYETKKRPKINPDYDETKEYIPREKRPEWNCVGLLGKLPLRKGQPTAPTWIKIKAISKDVELWLIK